MLCFYLRKIWKPWKGDFTGKYTQVFCIILIMGSLEKKKINLSSLITSQTLNMQNFSCVIIDINSGLKTLTSCHQL